MRTVEEIAENAIIIVAGYAFEKYESFIRVTNLDNISEVALFTFDGTLYETTMDTIQLEIVKDYFKRDRKFLFDEESDY